MLDTLLDDPPDTPWSKWAWGVSVPVLAALFGVKALVYQNVAWRLRGRRLDLVGTDAAWYGLALLAAAGFMHCHFLWTHHPKLSAYADLGKVVCLLAFVIGVGFVLFSQFRLI